MKAVSKKAEHVFRAAIARIPAGETSVKIDAGGGYMALHVECIGHNKHGAIYSFAHYGEQNGDLMRDPDVMMLDAATGQGLFPMSYRNDYAGVDNEYVMFTETGMSFHPKQQADLAKFCNDWAGNLAEQQEGAI